KPSKSTLRIRKINRYRGLKPPFAPPPRLKRMWLTLAHGFLGFVEYEAALVEKLEVDIQGTDVPEPGTVLGLLAISGLGLGLKRKKQS
ncbi:MAG: PEP-CTERM sorting domain-containing protein, partial [Crocosphaera sp.]